MHILFITTGGTIGSVIKGSYTGTSDEPSLLILDAFKKKYPETFNNINFEIMTPFITLSENMSGEKISFLTKLVKEKAKEDFDGIVVTHGTDTLSYTAAVLMLSLDPDCIPVCFVSSDKPLSYPEACGTDNLKAAADIINAGMRGVYVPYRNHNGTVYIHRPLYLTEADIYDDELRSIGTMHVCTSDNNILSPNTLYDDSKYRDCLLKLSETLPSASEMTDVFPEPAKHILRLKAFPGMKYPDISSEIRYIIFESFHSGTINTESEDTHAFCLEAYEKNIPVYITGTVKGITYESTKSFDKLHLIPVPDITPASLYMRLWCS